MTGDLLIILNNFCHDLASAIWFVSIYVIYLLGRYLEKSPSHELARFGVHLYRRLLLFNLSSLVLAVSFGVVRALNFIRLEWLPAAGRGQIVLLVVKHMFLIVMVAAGFLLLIRVGKQIKRM